MSIGSKKRARNGRTSGLELPPGPWSQFVRQLQRPDVLARLGLCVLAALAVWLVFQGWLPPLAYHRDDVLPRDLTARVAFKRPNPGATVEARELARKQEPVVYQQDPKELELLRASLDHSLTQILNAVTFADLDPSVWKDFVPPPAEGTAAPTMEDQEEAFEKFRAELGGAEGLERLRGQLVRVFAPLDKNGLLDKLPPEHGEGNRKDLAVYPLGRPSEQYLVPIADVLITDGAQVKKQLVDVLGEGDLAERLFAWVRPRLRPTLTFDADRTEERREAAAAAVPEQFTSYEPGQVLVPRGTPLSPEHLEILRHEHAEHVATLPLSSLLERGLSNLLVIAALMSVCGYFLVTRHPQIVADFGRLFALLFVVIVAAGLTRAASHDPWRAELIPLLLFGMTLSIAYQRDTALVLTLALAALVTLSGVDTTGQFLVLAGASACAILQTGEIRTRSKLIKVGFFTAAAAFGITLAVALIEEQPLGPAVLTAAGRNALWAFLTGFLMTGLLPFIEKLFGVLTDLSLLELGDVSHPLLQELVRRAPGTYNHSINVASLAEAAAEAIGARGLLVRVGAYFHDIGKMLKPGYFVENQGPAGNRHDQLMPAMSTLIIVAHVKDGADLARQHHLPQPIIDFIEQHHGTTLVEFFYRRASEQQRAEDPDNDVEESSFRYPGPKPQSIEAAVLMVADAVEGACRTLVEPTPARIESLVQEIAHKRLLDGQFDDCGLTLQQLHTISDSLVKSLAAVYHGRVRYPSQQTA